MWYYIFVAFLLLCGFFFARINAAYHHLLLIKTFVTVKSSKLPRLLIMQSNPLDMKGDNRKEYRNRFAVLGLVFYCLWLCLVVFSVVFLIFGPQTAIEPFEFDDGFFVSTLNQAAVFMLSLVFLGYEMSFYFLNIVRSPSVNENKVIRILWYIVVFVMFLTSVAGTVETIKLFYS